MPKGAVITVLLAVAVVPTRSRAQAPAGEEAGATDEAPAEVAVDAEALEQRLAQSEALVRNNQPTVQVGGYVDVGYFVPEGDGAGYVEDFGHF